MLIQSSLGFPSDVKVLLYHAFNLKGNEYFRLIKTRNHTLSALRLNKKRMGYEPILFLNSLRMIKRSKN